MLQRILLAADPIVLSDGERLRLLAEYAGGKAGALARKLLAL